MDCSLSNRARLLLKAFYALDIAKGIGFCIFELVVTCPTVAALVWATMGSGVPKKSVSFRGCVVVW